MRHPAIPYVVPFLALLVTVAAGRSLPMGVAGQAVRFGAVAIVLWIVSRHVIPLRPSRWLASSLVGAGVFLVWIGPDLLAPGWRQHWVLQNPIFGYTQPLIPEGLRDNLAALALRTARSALLVPLAEELFWRGWLMRWLISHNFTAVPLGAYAARAFWITAVLFASEHGPYWEVGLAAGIAYNWWMMRTRNLADCILAHGVTNAILSAYVIGSGKWEYWP